MNVLEAITDGNQKVVDFVQHREMDGIKGRLTSLCATLRITEGTLLLSAQIVRNALHAGAGETDAYIAGVRYAKAHQEPTPDLERSFRDYELARAAKRLSDAVRKPLSIDGELAAVDAAFGPEVA